MFELGRLNRLIVGRRVGFGYYLYDRGDPARSVLLPAKFAPEKLTEGDGIEVFLCLDSEDRIVATTRKPAAQVGDIALLRVRDVTEFGAFLDWNQEKDLLVPFREQPVRMEVGKSYLVYVYIDPVTGRIVASRRLGRFFRGEVSQYAPNQRVRLTVWEKARLGWRVVVDRRCIGLVYDNEIFRELSPGMELEGFVHAVRTSDNRLDIRLRRDGIRGVEEFKPVILDALEDAGGFLPLHAKSSPVEIAEYFSFSKRVFKQAVGMLYKERRITVSGEGIRLARPSAETR